MTITVKILDAAETQLSATINGREWTGIKCQRVDGALVIDGDGQIASEVTKWMAEGGVPLAYQPPPLDEVKAAALARVAAKAKGMRAAIAETDDPIRIAAWANKASIARRVATQQTVSTAEQQSLATEVAARGRGETVAQLVDKILHWADADANAAALVEGMQKSAEAAIDAATSREELAATIATIETHVAQRFAAVMAGRAAA